ncbi:hypothetical protein [Nocardia terpenica]|uniref:Uncharacterized protein n=1 Tax=Nocardia terpenica TaxID=455432 RepID=A0A164KL23_9NOCA|nr:hypothetical protein [Nocardia terpenica]KZM71502.1 hypothetical protein AWN90_01780 [Nocardia terpenica]NQE90688.1 hypothetical protein [Nocardia terpenica]
MNGGEVVRLGPIRPEHVGSGWLLEGDDQGEWFLCKPIGTGVVRIFATASACGVGLCLPDGRMVRGMSARDVDDAKALADKLIREVN